MNKQERIRGLIKGHLSPHLIYAHSHSINEVVDSLIELLNSEGMVIAISGLPTECIKWNGKEYTKYTTEPIVEKENNE